MAGSLADNLRQSYDYYMCVVIDLLLISMVVGVIVGIPMSSWIVFMVVLHSCKVCFIAIQGKI